MTKVQKIFVRNLRQIDEMTTTFNWCTAIVTGGNNKGKSTLLKSIVERLRWDKTNIVKDGKQSGEAEWTFTDGSVLSWEILGESDKIVYTTKDGIKTSSIKEICNRLFGVGFDIDEFLWAQPKRQKEIMQWLVGLKEEFELLDAEYAEAYNDRTNKNAIYRAEQSKIWENKEISTGWEYVDISALQEELIEAEKKNEQINSINSKMQDKNMRLANIVIEIQRLQEEQKTIREDIKNWTTWLDDNKPIDTTELREKITTQKEINEKHDQNRKFHEQRRSLIEAKKIADEADEAVKVVEQKKLDLIKSANMPKWFEFSEEGLIFNWYPLDRSHLSSSQTYIAGLLLASMNMGEVQALTFDASYLDKNSLAEIEERAKQNDLQLLIERPDYDGGDIRYEIIE